MSVVSPTFVQRPAHPNNFSRGRVGGRNGQCTFHHIVGSAEVAALTFANPGRQASSTYSVTDIPGVIFQHVSVNDTSYADGNGASNARAITIEHHGDWRFGYYSEVVINNSALLIAWLISQGLIDHWYRHRDVSLLGTQCCADLPVEEIWRRADALLGGKASPVAAGAKNADIIWKKYPTVTRYRVNKATSLWRFDAKSWDTVGSVQKFSAGEIIEIAGEGFNPDLNATYLVSAFSFDKKIANGFNRADLDKITNTPAAPATPAASIISWFKLPKPVEYQLKRDATLWDFNREKHADMKAIKQLKKGDRFTAAANSTNTKLGSTYAVAEFSYKSRSTIGINLADLEAYVPPKEPAVPVTPEWQRNLKDIAAQKLIVLGAQAALVNLETGATIKQIGGGTVVDVVKTTKVAGVEYLISSYSASVGAGSGMKRAELGVPVAPPSKEKPAWLERWEDIEDQNMYARADTNLYNLEDSAVVKVIPRGEKVRVASTTEVFGQRYALTEYSTKLMEGRGIRLDDLDLKPVTDGGPAPAPAQPALEEKVDWLTKGVGSILDKLGINRP